MRTRLWREAHLGVKIYKTQYIRTIFGRPDVETVQAVVVRKTEGFGSALFGCDYIATRSTSTSTITATSTTTTTSLPQLQEAPPLQL